MFFGLVDVNFSAITTMYREGKVYIEWQTLSERHNKNFIIEKSNNAVDFIPIETIAAYSSSTSLKRYSAIDLRP